MAVKTGVSMISLLQCKLKERQAASDHKGK